MPPPPAPSPSPPPPPPSFASSSSFFFGGGGGGEGFWGSKKSAREICSISIVHTLMALRYRQENKHRCEIKLPLRPQQVTLEREKSVGREEEEEEAVGGQVGKGGGGVASK